jgi:FKBP-type peptidyl-prolyl cis-trans isomerase 2
MSQAKSGDTVKIHYTGKLADGMEFDSSKGSDPLSFTLGKGEVIPGFEQAVKGLAVGETKTVEIPSDQAYGPHRNEMVIEAKRSEMPEGLELKMGRQLEGRSEGEAEGEAQRVIFTITGLTDDSVTLDANHPLAGKDLTFDIELVEIG